MKFRSTKKPKNLLHGDVADSKKDLVREVSSETSCEMIAEMHRFYRTGKTLRQVAEKFRLENRKVVATLFAREGLSKRRHAADRRSSAYRRGKLAAAMKSIPKKELKKMFLSELLPIDQIAARFGCHRSKIYRAVDYYKIPKRSILTGRIPERDWTKLEAAVRRLLDEGKTIAEIAREFGYHSTSIYKKLQKFGISPPRKKIKSKEKTNSSGKQRPGAPAQLKKMTAYYERGHSFEETGVKFGISGQYAGKLLKRAGAKIRKHTMTDKAREAHRKIAEHQRIIIAKEILERLYVAEKLSAARIAAEFNVSIHTVTGNLRNYGIPVRTRRKSIQIT